MSIGQLKFVYSKCQSMYERKMSFIEEMRKLIDERSHYQYFYKCNTPVKIKEVRAFERDMHITLPENYVRYLTELGNGGRYGHYHIYSLERIRENMAKKITEDDDTELPPMLDHSLSDDIWKEFGEKYAEADINGDYTRDMEKRMLAGGIVIGTAGCTMMLVLMCRGAATGEVFLVDFDYMEYLKEEPCLGKFEDFLINEMRESIERAKSHIDIRTITKENADKILPGINLIDVLVDMRIRQLREEGAKEVCDIAPALKDYYNRHFDDRSFRAWIAVHEGEIVGTCGMSIVEKPPYYSCQTGRIGLLSSVYTVQGFRRRGVAKNLVKTAIRFAKMMKCGAIHITASNDGVKLYTALGFTHNENFMQMKL